MIMVEAMVSLFQIVYGLLAYVCIGVVLVAIAWSDVRTRRIPNQLIIALLVIRALFFVLELLGGAVGHALMLLAHSIAISAITTIFLIVLKLALDRIMQEDSLGWGDVKLVAAGCLFLSWEGSFSALFIASVAGLVFALGFRLIAKDRTFPFGPALCLGIAIGLFI